ncbi:DUF2798 domain-containing protein [Quatrionicoccus australiensis]|uniref:DUF2798 domain-containing protein n=1 Tax=Quatrionicoccus australiensis TaxID=138118 RepID=UPI001CF8118D|nr:DUF2798 domain-containing protein [Quatrionicoccus australiensis]UCV15511.1 DUF2798 domain-containing protein [Quatrionicoccus australiensis]
MSRLKPKHIQPIIMSGIMAGLMTGFVTWLNLGLPGNFLALWTHAFIVAWPIAACTAFLAIPVSVKLTGRILAWLGADHRQA